MLIRCLALASLVCLQDPRPAVPAPAVQVHGFTYRSGALPVGRVYHYRKSNLDGSHASEIDLCVAGETRLESLKHHPEDAHATLVTAELDWEVFSVRRFTNHRVGADGARTLMAELAVSADRRKLGGKAGELTLECELPGFPWHSYDFDLSSLNLALRFLSEPEGECELEIVDPVQDEQGPRLAARGKVTLAYEEDEERNGLACRRYLLDGPGLEHRGGALWVAKGDDPFLVAYEIDLPDEPGMQSGRLEWLGSETLTAEQWAARVGALGKR